VSTHPQPPAAAPGGGPGPWTGAPFGQPYPSQVSRDDQQSSGADQVVFSIASMLGGVVAGFAGGAAWAALADPPKALITQRGAFLVSEVSYDHQVTVTLWFLVVGIVGGLVVGAVIGLLGRRHGLAVVVAAILMSAVATGLAAWSGINVFGPDGPQPHGGSPGDLVPTALSITSDVAYLGWPIGALIGVLLATAVLPNSAFKTTRGGDAVR
jgi:ribose/xylose/arabinose/galactoside ABC-type transport system permease subunit